MQLVKLLIIKEKENFLWQAKKKFWGGFIELILMAQTKEKNSTNFLHYFKLLSINMQLEKYIQIMDDNGAR